MFTDESFQNKTTPGVPDVFENPHSWNTVANMLFLETPPSVGYSYCGSGTGNGSAPKCHWDDATQAVANYGALLSFFESFPELKAGPPITRLSILFPASIIPHVERDAKPMVEEITSVFTSNTRASPSFPISSFKSWMCCHVIPTVSRSMFEVPGVTGKLEGKTSPKVDFLSGLLRVGSGSLEAL